MGRAGPLIAARLASATLSLSIPLVLARTMALPEYGTYKQLFLVSMTASGLVPLGMAQSLYFFVPRTTERRACLAHTLAFLAVAGAAGGLALWLLGPRIATWLSNPALLEHRLELALYTALLVGAVPLEISMTAQGRTGRAAATYLVSDASKAAVIVLPTLAGHGLHAMMAGMIAWAGARLAATWAIVLPTARGPVWDGPLLRRQLAYALPFGMAIAFSIPQQYAHQFIVAHAVGPALFAVYAVACFELPFVDLFYTPTGEVLMVQLGELDRAGRRSEGAAAFREAVDRLAIILLPPILFVWAVAPTFILTVFGWRFEAAVPVFRVCLLVMPLAIWPIDATLRARGATGHILLSYVVKAAVAIPLAWVSVQRWGLMGAAASYVAAEFLGRLFLGARLPAALSSPGARVRLRDLVPAARLLRTLAASVALALAGAGALELARAAVGGRPEATLTHRLLPLCAAGALFAVGHAGLLLASGVKLPGALGTLLARIRARPSASLPIRGERMS
jgi:O-antigen/teichoic acid export membrane protein